MKLHYNNITIIGGGTSGHISALFLAKNFPNKQITWIFPKENNSIGVGEATVPYVQDFLTELGIDIKTVLKKLNGNLKLGIKFVDFFDDIRYHPFGNTLDESILLLKYMKDNKVPDNILNFKDIASQFDVNMLYSLIYNKLKTFDNVKIVRRDYIDTDIKDFVIDCTGFKRKIIQSDIYKSEKLINDTAIIHRSNKKINKPYSTFTALNAGWVWEIPLLNNTSYGYVFNSKEINIDKATNLFKNFLKENGEYKVIKMTSGRNVNQFKKTNNATIVGIGLSSFFIEPLESTGLYFVVYALNNLKNVLNNKMTEEHYTDNLNKEFDNVTNFIAMHFKESTHKNFNIYNTLKINKSNSNLFPIRSWDYISKKEMSQQVPKVNNKNIKLLSKLKDINEITII